jgi:serine/threonine protein kinase
VLKVSRIPEGADLLKVERAALARVLKEAGDTHYRHYIPTLVESFPVRDRVPRRINVLLHEPGLSTLEQVHARHPALDGRHLGWIFNRLLTALGLVHRCGLVHGAVVPAHVLVHAEDHGLRLVGWVHSVRRGRRITTGAAAYRDWYPPEVRHHGPAVPATDIYLAARCVVYLAGGDPISGRMPDAVPRALGAFLRSCLLDGPRMRPDDAWELHDDFDDLLRDLYGAPTYHRLEMP